MPDKITEAVEQAVETLAGKTEETENTSAETSPAENTESEKVEEEKSSEGELDARTTYALQLLDALENPKTAKLVVENLAKQSGLLQQTEKQQEKTIKGIKQIVKEKLGDGGSFIADELGDALEEIIESRIGSLKEEFETREQRREAERYANEYNQVVSKLKITDEEAGELNKLADKFPWNGKVSLEEYLTDLTELHRSKVSKAKDALAKKQKQQEVISKKPKNLGIEGSEGRTIKGSAKISPREAVLAALRGERFED